MAAGMHRRGRGHVDHVRSTGRGGRARERTTSRHRPHRGGPITTTGQTPGPAAAGGSGAAGAVEGPAAEPAEGPAQRPAEGPAQGPAGRPADSSGLRAAGRDLARAAQIVLAVGLVLLPLASALLAVRLAPPATVEVAGQAITVRPVLGRDTSRLFGGALVSPQHASVAGLDIGMDVDANWNQVVPSDKQTREYLLNLWENPRPALHLIRDAAADHLVGWAVGGFATGAAVSIVVGGLWWQRRRRLARYGAEQAAAIRDYGRATGVVATAVGVVAVVAVDVAGAATYLDRHHVRVEPSAQLAGTPLADTQVTGLLGDVLPFVSALRPRSAFYDTVAVNLRTALARTLGTPGATGAEEEQDAGGTTTPSTTPTTTPPTPDTTGDGAGKGADRTADTVTFVLAEDFEDVNGMARQVGLAAHLLDADFIALTGDLTFAGKPVETYLLDTIDYYSEKTPVLLAAGLHDTPTIVRAAQVRDWQVGDGSTVDIAGLRILAAADPRISTVGDFGSRDVLRDPDVDVDAFVEQTIQQACAEKPDFVLLHDAKLGARIAASGCARTAVLDGRSFTFRGPQEVTTTSDGSAVEFTSGSAGGHVSTQANPGIIRHPARFSVLRVTPSTGATDYAVVTVRPDAGVDVTGWTALPRARSHG